MGIFQREKGGPELLSAQTLHWFLLSEPRDPIAFPLTLCSLQPLTVMDTFLWQNTYSLSGEAALFPGGQKSLLCGVACSKHESVECISPNSMNSLPSPVEQGREPLITIPTDFTAVVAGAFICIFFIHFSLIRGKGRDFGYPVENKRGKTLGAQNKYFKANIISNYINIIKYIYNNI